MALNGVPWPLIALNGPFWCSMALKVFPWLGWPFMASKNWEFLDWKIKNGNFKPGKVQEQELQVWEPGFQA